MSNRSPWDDIERPNVDFHVRLVADSGPVRVFWGKDVSDRRLLIVELEGDNTSAFQKGRVQVHGISVELLQSELTGVQSLVFRLERSSDQDLFLNLCRALISALRQSTSRTAAIHVSLAHLRRWKSFLSSGRTHGLTPEEVRGLFGELEMLEVIKCSLPSSSAVEAWCGPLGGQQDYVYGETAVEVKTLSGPNRGAVRISSEDQLDGVDRRLLLAVLRIVEATDRSEALSLNAKVDRVVRSLFDASAEEKLWARLGSVGYVPVSDYDAPEYIITSKRYFSIEKSFPRLTRANIPVGLVRVSYDIQLDSVERFEVGEGALWSPS